MYAVISVLVNEEPIYVCGTFAFTCIGNTLYTFMYVVVSVLVKKVVISILVIQVESLFQCRQSYLMLPQKTLI